MYSLSQMAIYLEISSTNLLHIEHQTCNTDTWMLSLAAQIMHIGDKTSNTCNIYMPYILLMIYVGHTECMML